MTLGQLLEEGKEQLKNAGVADFALDARYLLLAAFDLSLASFLACRSRDVSGTPEDRERENAFRRMIARRAGRIPLQQILGVQEFMGLEFLVNEHVLIPRQDTETLVELVLEEQKDREKSVLDLCTGSGCIAISLARLGKFRQVWALDVSEEALKVAEENGRRLLGEGAAETGERLLGEGAAETGGRLLGEGEECAGDFCLIRSDLFEGLPKGKKFDILVSNPPYIPTKVIEGLEPEVRDHEPRMALDGDGDGLKFYRLLAAGSGEYLNQGGALYLEIGWDQSGAVEELLRQAGFEEIRTVQDMAGKDRVVRAVWKK